MTIVPPSPSPARVLRRWLLRLLSLGVMAWLAAWAWHQPWIAAPRAMWALQRQPAPVSLPVPVQGVASARIADTFGAPRGRDRTHAGVDVFAPRGTPVLSATEGVVVAIREQGLGGRQVWVLGPGGQRHYYAHLQSWRADLQVGDRVAVGEVLGAVGDTGNARGTPPHLHYGIYASEGALDPLPLLQARRPRSAD